LSSEANDQQPATPTTDEAPPPNDKGRGLAWRIFLVVTILACAPSVLGFMGGWHWRYHQLSPFRMQYAIVLSAFTAAFILMRKWKYVAIPAAFAALNIALIMPLYLNRPAPPKDATPFRLLLSNVYAFNEQRTPLLKLIREEDPDLLVLQEYSTRWEQEFAPSLSAYPHRLLALRNSPFSIAVYSKLPIISAKTLFVKEDSNYPYLILRMAHGDKEFNLIATHPVPPISRQWVALREEALIQIQCDIIELTGPTILVGDLNMTSWSPIFRHFIRVTGLHDSRRGFGIQPTWPANNPILQVPLDHCLVSDDISVHRRAIGGPIGSDHLPVIIDLSIKE
jgi:endonuclease/exonuclease/phosphatase (EEP) superfamily protein YafD